MPEIVEVADGEAVTTAPEAAKKSKVQLSMFAFTRKGTAELGTAMPSGEASSSCGPSSEGAVMGGKGKTSGKGKGGEEGGGKS